MQVLICTEGIWYDDSSWPCQICTQHHVSDNNMSLPVVNSLRIGFSGYIKENNTAFFAPSVLSRPTTSIGNQTN
jgi:hypothetical protein